MLTTSQAGLGNGMAVAVLPMWNSECARGENRGRAVMWQLNVNIVRYLHVPVCVLTMSNLFEVRHRYSVLGRLWRESVYSYVYHRLVLEVSSCATDRLCSHHNLPFILPPW
jgi:hypothetical protein